MTILEQKIVELGKEGKTPNEVKVLLNSTRTTVIKYFKKHNIKLEGSGGKNRKMNFNPFETLNPEVEYWLGFLAADGNIHINNCISLHQAGKNKEHMYKYWEFLNKRPNLWHRVNKSGNEVLGISFTSNKIADTLRSYGLHCKKSLNLKLDIPLTWNIVRGYFDGDGSVRNDSKRGLEIKFTTASKRFANQLSTFFTSENIVFSLKTEVDKKGCKHNIYRLYILKPSKKEFIRKFYNNSTIFMERKYQIMVGAL